MTKMLDHYIGFALALILTMASLAYTFWSMTEWPDNFELVPSAATVFVEQTDIPKDVPWTGSQVVAKIYELSGGTIPVEVDGVAFNDELDILHKQSAVRLYNDYLMNISYNGSGQIELIKFTTKGA